MTILNDGDMKKENIDRNIDIFSQVIGGDTTVTVATRYGMSQTGVSLIYYSTYRFLRRWAIENNEQWPTIYNNSICDVRRLHADKLKPIVEKFKERRANAI